MEVYGDQYLLLSQVTCLLRRNQAWSLLLHHAAGKIPVHKIQPHSIISVAQILKHSCLIRMQVASAFCLFSYCSERHLLLGNVQLFCEF
jgi:hypothetical protein